MEEKHLLIAEKFGSSSVGKGVEILLRDDVRVNKYKNRNAPKKSPESKTQPMRNWTLGTNS